MKTRSARQIHVLTATIAIALLTQCAKPQSDTTVVTGPEPAANSVETVVDDSGFIAVVDGATVSAPAGVAPAGTPVRVDVIDHQLPERWDRIAAPLAGGLRVELGDGLQPQSLVTISFTGLDAGSDVFVLSESTGQDPALLGQPTGDELVVTSDHLSNFWPILVDVGKFADSIFRSGTDALQMTTPQPDCFVGNGRYPDFDMRISEVRSDVVWPCLAQDAGTTLALRSNSSVAWRVKTAPAWDAQPPTSLTAANAVALAAWQRANSDAQDPMLLLPGESVDYTVADAPAATTIGLQVDPVMSQVRTLALGLGFLLPQRTADRIGQAECLPDLLTSGAVENTPSAAGFAAILRCFGAAIGGGDGALVNLLAAAPAALWAQLEGVLRSATGVDEVTFTVESTDSEAAGTGEPIDRAAVEQWLGEWTGAVDQPGSPPYSVRLNLSHNGRTVVGTVAYPELACSGQLDDANLAGSVLTVEETITVNGRCLTSVDLELTLRPGEIGYHFDRSGGGDGVLHRL